MENFKMDPTVNGCDIESVRIFQMEQILKREKKDWRNVFHVNWELTHECLQFKAFPLIIFIV